MSPPHGRLLAAAGAITVGAQLLPAAASIAPLRRRVAPRLAGISDRRHIALTYDDGPDHATTPRFVEMLERRDVRATFFLLGEHVERECALVADLTAAGHEVAVHGWDHRCPATRRPGGLAEELVRAREVIEDVSGQEVVWWRPPYGVLTGEGLLAARRAGLSPVLWSSWGVDWSCRATPDTVVRRVDRTLVPGGTVLLHDTDRTAAPGSWQVTLAASELLLDRWYDADVAVGPLREHW